MMFANLPEFLAFASLPFALGAYAVMIWHTARLQMPPQNPWTFLLWGVLNTIAGVSVYITNGNWMLIGMYAVASFVMAGVVFYAIRRGAASRAPTLKQEGLAALLVTISTIVYLTASKEAATVAATLGVVFAALPLAVDLGRKPQGAPFKSYLALTMANLLDFLAARDWSIQEAFYPSVCLLLMVAMDLLAARQWLPKYRLRSA